jgi:O-antigen/teichoic acid export membrane protein
VAAGWLLIEAPLPFFARASASDFRLSLLLVAPLVLTIALAMLLVGARRFALHGAINLLNTGATLIFTLLFVGALRMDVAGALLATGLATFVAIVAQTRALRRDAGDARSRPSRRDYLAITSYGLRYYVARFGNVVNTQIGLVLVAWLGSAAEIGLFAAASVLIQRLFVLPESITTALQPRIEGEGRPELVAMTARVSLLVSGAAFAAFVAASPLVVPALLSPSFAGCVPLFAITAPGAWLKGATRPLTAYFIGIDRPGVVSLSTAAELAANALLVPLLYRAAGLGGASAAVSIGYAASAVVLALAYRRAAESGFRETWRPRRSDLDAICGIVSRASRRGASLARLEGRR